MIANSFSVVFLSFQFAGEDPGAQQEFTSKVEDDTQAAQRKREGTRRERKVSERLL